jgi:hypothetical protein
MGKFALAMAATALFAFPTPAFPQTFEFGPGGVRIEPHGYHHGGYEARCRELRELVSTRRSWAKKVKVIANGIAVCAA